MTKIGYARVSTIDQDLQIELAAPKAAGCGDMIRSEKVSGTSTNGRAELKTILDFLRPGDELVVTRIDRLARSVGDLQDIVRTRRPASISKRSRRLTPFSPRSLPRMAAAATSSTPISTRRRRR